MKKASTTTTTPATPSTKAQKFEILALVIAAVLFTLMCAGKMHWIPGIIGAAYIVLWIFCNLVKNTTVTQLFCGKKAKAKKKPAVDPAIAEKVAKLDSMATAGYQFVEAIDADGDKVILPVPSDELLKNKKDNAWTLRVKKLADGKKAYCVEEAAKLTTIPAGMTKGALNIAVPEPKAAPATSEDKEIAKKLLEKGCPPEEVPEAVRKVKALKPLGFTDEEAVDEVMKPRT